MGYHAVRLPVMHVYRLDGRFLCVKRLTAIDAVRMCTYSRAPGLVSCATLHAISTRAPSRTPMALSMMIIIIIYLHMARRYLRVMIAGGPPGLLSAAANDPKTITTTVVAEAPFRPGSDARRYRLEGNEANSTRLGIFKG